ncbi:hypothetical protein ACM3CZ_13910 [Edwardsiella ictaluri]
MAEFGIVVPRGIQRLQLQLPEILEDADNSLPSLFRAQLSLLHHHMTYLFDIVAAPDQHIEQCYRGGGSPTIGQDRLPGWGQSTAKMHYVSKIPGIGPITATVLIAAIGNTSNLGIADSLSSRT